MSDNISHFGQKIVQSIYNPNIVENENDNDNENENIECNTNNGDDDEVKDVGKNNFMTQELSLLHSLTSMAYKAVNISSYTKNDNSNNSNNNKNINNDDNNNNNNNNDDNVNNNIDNDNNNYSVNKLNSNSKANLIINNKLPSSLNRNNIGNIGNGNENISGINIQVPHLIPSSGPGSGLSHSLSKHNTPRDFTGNIYSNHIMCNVYWLISAWFRIIL